MATPGMLLVPLAVSNLEKKYPKIKTSMPLTLSIQLVLVGICLTFATPLCCALFPQLSSVEVKKLEPEIKQKLAKDGFKETDLVYYNKGL